jgi:hypothetical protein
MRQIWYSMSLQYYLCRKYLHIKVYLRVSKYMHICISIICEFSNTQVNLFSPGNYNFFYIKKPELTKNRTIHYIHKRKGEEGG